MKSRMQGIVAIVFAVVAVCGGAAADDRVDMTLASAWHDASNPAGAFPGGLYDGDTSTLGLINYADQPVEITFLFAGSVTLVGARAWWSNAWGDPAYTWDFECADSVADLDSQTGSYVLLASNVETPSDTWSQASFVAVACHAVRWRGYRVTGDHFLHLTELELVLAVPGSAAARKVTEPAGVAFDAAGQTVVADVGEDALIVVDDSGLLKERLGDGVLADPLDVEVDAVGRYVVADTGNDRVVRLAGDGSVDLVVASSGNGADEVLQPSGVAIDSSGRILVADTGHHRVIRFLGTGGLDTSFGSGGAVGGPSSTWNDSGFDGPRGVAWDPYLQQLLVADTNNERVQILTEDGVYLRTIDAVYHPYDVEALADGTIVSVGDGVNYPHRKGSIRFTDPGGEFVDRQKFGGSVEIGRLTGGVAVNNGGELVVADRTRGTLHRLAGGDRPALSSLAIRNGSDWIEASYETREAVATRVYYGVDGLSRQAEDATPTTRHRLRVSGLLPDTTYEISVAYPRTMDGQFVFAPVREIRTEPSATESHILRLRTVGVIYTANRTTQQVSDAHDRLELLEQFYFRHSGGRLYVDVEVLEVQRVYDASDVESSGFFKPASAEADLAAAGYGPADEIDEVVIFFGGVAGVPGGNLAGGATIFGRNVGYGAHVTPTPFVLFHEVNHTIDSIFNWMGYEPYEYNHGLWAVPSVAGFDMVVNGEILQHVDEGRYAVIRDPFQRLLSVVDADGDGLSDSEPGLPLTEAIWGTDDTLPDTDFDGLSDLEELIAGTTVGTDPLAVDTDGDGATQGADGLDRNPLVAIEGYVTRASPVVDGVISVEEGWTTVSSGIDLLNGCTSESVADPNHHPEAEVWAAWDDGALYLAARYSPSSVTFKLDANGDGWFTGYDNHLLQFNTTDLGRSAIAAADRDLMFAIDDVGGWSEIHDDSAKWLDAPPGGLGLERLLPPGSVEFATGPGPGGDRVAELRIPAGRRRQLAPTAGQEVRLYASLDDDPIWDHDTFARLLLVEADDSDGDGLWDLQETDLGSDPVLSDGDGDGLSDTEELAVGLDPLDQDSDGDGALDPADCAPRDPGAVSVPASVQGLAMDSGDHLHWQDESAAGSDVRYDLVRENAGGAPGGGVCVSGSGLTDPEYLDVAVPLPGIGWRYLVRARTRCGAGSWGRDSSGIDRLRSCP